MKERDVQDAIRRELCRGEVRLFRNNSGRFKDARGRWVVCGIPPKGGSDLIGWKTVTVTPAMAGTRLAVFCAVEVKGPGGRTSPEQENFIRQVRAAGGLAGVAASTEEARAILLEPS